MKSSVIPPPFWVLIPARLASTRLPNKPLALIGGVPMVVRVAQQAALSDCTACVVATDDVQILEICQQHAVRAILTRPDHPSGSDRLAEACAQLAIPDEAIVVNVQGDEPLIPPNLIQAVATVLYERPECVMATAGHAIERLDEFHNPNVVKLVTDAQQRALYFSRAPIPWWRDRPNSDPHSNAIGLSPADAPLRHIGIYAYRASFLRQFPTLQASPLERIESLEQLRVLWHGHGIAVHLAEHAPPGGVDTPEDLERVRAVLQKGKTGFSK
ncbi:MAG: 3-deoxy-manno-octulosonate cytidylyltransferase [Pseudomonadota bacterium]